MNTKALSLILVLAILGSLGTLYMKSASHQISTSQGLSIKDVGFIDNLDLSELQYRVSQFNEWAERHQKSYSAIEAVLRFKAWNKNYEFVQDHNSKNLSWTVEMNLFADLSREEFAALHLGLNARDYVYDESTVEWIEEDENEDPNDSVDWRKKGAVTSIKNQGSCGACYAFASVAGLEGVYKIKKGSLKTYSPQQIASCSSSYGNNGCNGGLMTNSYKYTTAKGIELESSYPWTGNTGSCKYSSSKVVFKNKGQKTVTRNSYTQLKAAVKKQPVPVGVEADQSGFQMYKSGVLSTNCGTNLDHAITVVGYSGTNYWIVKNQWGSSWGLSGYIHIKMGSQNGGAGVCGINSMATYPTL